MFQHLDQGSRSRMMRGHLRQPTECYPYREGGNNQSLEKDKVEFNPVVNEIHRVLIKKSGTDYPDLTLPFVPENILYLNEFSYFKAASASLMRLIASIRFSSEVA